MRKIVFLSFVVLHSYHCSSQNIELTKEIVLQKIHDLQCKNHAFFNDGLFPSQRYMGKIKNAKEDNNIFYTALIAYTLQSIRKNFTEQHQQLIDTIISRAKSNYFRYRNRNGGITYNYWQTNPDQPMPNSKFWSKREKIKLPDDFDDTSIIFLTKEKQDSLDFLLKQKFIPHTNNYDRKIRSTFRRYRDYNAYYTWFGKKMKQDFDICVLSNTLLFIFSRELTLNEHDEQTIDLIEQMVLYDDHLDHPHIVSPHYKKSTVILYHLARLLSETDHEKFTSLREKIINDLKNSSKLAKNRMEKMLLLTSLYRLHETVPYDIDLKNINTEFKDYSFFVANPFSGSSLLKKRIMGKKGFLNLKTKSEAYYWTLILEFLTLKEIG